MAYNTTINFPTSIDDRIFINDVKSSQKDIYNAHKNYIKNEQLQEASTYINSQDVTPVNADLCNLIENMINVLQTYESTMDKCLRPVIGERPITPVDETEWIGDV